MQKSNQWGMTPEAGELDLSLGLNNSMAVLVDPSAADSVRLSAGETVQLIDLGTGDYSGVNPVVGKRAAVEDPVFGIVVKSKKTFAFGPKDIVDVALEGSVLRLKASAAINRGVTVYADLANAGQVTGAASGPGLGISLDKAGAAGDLVRVLVKFTPVEVEG